MPINAKDSAEAHKIHTLQLGRLIVTYDDRDRDDSAGTGKLAYIEDTESDCQIVFDLERLGVSIVGNTGVHIKADGLVSIEGSQVSINGRVVQHTSRLI